MLLWGCDTLFVNITKAFVISMLQSWPNTTSIAASNARYLLSVKNSATVKSGSKHKNLRN